MTIAGIRVLTIGKTFSLPHNVAHIEGTTHLLETIATFRPDVIVTPEYVPGALTQACHELRKRWIHVPPDVSAEELCSLVEGCYSFNLWTENQFAKDHPMVSVYTPTHDSGDYLQDTFQSLRGQTYANWEWVVVDDHSSDKTWARLQEFAAQDYRVRPFQSGMHLGKIGALKDLTTRLCRGKYLVELDHDDMLTETALDEVKNAFEAHPDVGMVYTNSASFYENGNPQRFSGSPWDDPNRYREVEYHGRKYLECSNPNIYDRFGPHFTQVFGWFLTVGPHHIRAFRADTFRQLGGYNPELPIADDWDLYARFFLESKCFHIDKLLYLYRYRDGFGNVTFQRLQSIQDHLALGRNHYVERFRRKNEELLASQTPVFVVNDPTPKPCPDESPSASISFVVLDATGKDNAVDCLKSLKLYAPDAEIILVENGCDSKARKEAHTALTSSHNLGFGAGCNLGASAATRPYLCFINDDAALVDAETIPKLLVAAKMNAIAGAYSDRAKPPQGDWSPESAPKADQVLPMVAGLCMVMSKSLFDSLGGFDPRFLTWEDDDLCVRARRRGASCVAVGGTFVHHKGHQTFEAMKLDHVAVEDKNHRLFNLKHPKIKIIAIAKNEENCIVEFFKQFESITHDWYMLDTGSTDRTIELADSIGVRVESAPFVDFATTRNQALNTFDPKECWTDSEGSWVIMLDPDERLDKQTIAAIPELIFNRRIVSQSAFDTYLAPLTAVYPDGSRKEFVAKPFLFKNNSTSKWVFKVHEKWVTEDHCSCHGQCAIVTNALIEHRIEFHTGKHRDGAEDLYSRLMSEEPYFQDPEYKAKMREDHPILDYDHTDDPRIAKIQAGPLVSVVIPTYKRTDLLRKAVLSALTQSYKTLEVIIVGDHCPELDSAAFDVSPYSEEPRVRVINLAENHGAGGAEPRNIAINLATGQYIAYLDDDNTWAKDHVSNLLTTILAEKSVWGWSSMMVNGVDLNFDRLERGKIDTSCVIHHKSLIQKHGVWKPRTEANYWHDYELFSRWRKEPQTVTGYPSVSYNASASGQGAFLASLTSSDQVTDLPFEPSAAIPPEPNLLTIGILSLESRADMLSKLLQELERQQATLPSSNSVKIVLEVDNGDATVGGKRQKIINECSTEYLCFVDDDDLVEPTYLQSVLRALKGKPDCVTFKGIVTTDNHNPEQFRLSLHYPAGAWSKDAQGTHMRTPNHLCPMKIEIMRKVTYRDITSYEDALWGMWIHPLLHSQCHIDEVLYHYRYSPTGSEAAKRAPKLIPGKLFELGADGLFYDLNGKSYAPEKALEILNDLIGATRPQDVTAFTLRYPVLFKELPKP
jgi:glycosyltransferase involved in cell wall biosynthesis